MEHFPQFLKENYPELFKFLNENTEIKKKLKEIDNEGSLNVSNLNATSNTIAEILSKFQNTNIGKMKQEFEEACNVYSQKIIETKDTFTEKYQNLRSKMQSSEGGFRIIKNKTSK